LKVAASLLKPSPLPCPEQYVGVKRLAVVLDIVELITVKGRSSQRV
jgi:hypothetical protein